MSEKLTKSEAIHDFVEQRLSSIPQEWVSIVAEHYNEPHRLPMWGTMWFIDDVWGEKLHKDARIMEEYEEGKDEELYDEEMEGERCILDENGNTTPLFIYEIEGEYLLGVHGAGYNFYHGVWDKLYDTLQLKWHQLIECASCKEEKLSVNEIENALSRKDNKTYICNDCGTKEAMEDYEKSKK